MNGIVSYGVYLPYWRLQRSAIGGVLGAGGGRGTRSVASFDEDTTSLGVEAARITLRNAPEGARPGIVTFSTTAPATSKAGIEGSRPRAACTAVALVL